MLNKSYFMQDGATPHTALSTRRYLKDIFGKKIIGKHFEYTWPPYSPDLTLADYWLWPTLKRVVYSGKQEPYTSIASLKRAITFVYKKIKQQNLTHLGASIEGRLKKCLERRGYRL